MRSPTAFLKGVRHPEAFHGDGVRGGFFEGWYIKVVSADLSQRWAIIPGIFRRGGAPSDDEAFVQVLDGLTGRSWYHRFDPADFTATTSGFDVRIGPNTFNSSGMTLQLPGLSGHVAFTSPLDPFPVSRRTPGIMGWFAYVPFMECFHGVVSFGHTLAGELDIDGAPHSFRGGRGYVEKDWGRAFPAGYVWAASNHLTDLEGMPNSASLMASCAIIPGLGRTFRGSIVALRSDDGVATWATWNRARDEHLRITDSHVEWAMRGPHGRLELNVERVRGGLLHAPLRTAMHQRVEETMDARIALRHTDREGRVRFDGVAACAGLEVFGDIDRLSRL